MKRCLIGLSLKSWNNIIDSDKKFLIDQYFIDGIFYCEDKSLVQFVKSKCMLTSDNEGDMFCMTQLVRGQI